MSLGDGMRIFMRHANRYLWSSTVSVYPLARYSVAATNLQYEKDPGPLFNDPHIQKLLKSITRLQLDGVYKKRFVPDNKIEYKFMSTEELENEIRKATELAEKRMQMPPIVKIKEDSGKIIARDPAIKNFSDTKFVITDITYGSNAAERKVLVRQIDGSLEYAPLSVRKRMNQTYFPLPGRKIRLPRIFETNNLKRCLDNHEYEMILDRACVQFEPYEKEYHDITAAVYDHINETKLFDLLRSTRHFGPMSFYFAWHRIIDDLLYDMIKRDYLKNGVELITLYNQLNNVVCNKDIQDKVNALELRQKQTAESFKKDVPDDIHEKIKTAIGKTDEDFTADDIHIQFIEWFVKSHALKKVHLELALQALQEINDEKKKLYKGLKKAHGLS